MKRVLVGEMMDNPDVPKESLAEALGYIRGVNKHLGGVSSLISTLESLRGGWKPQEPITLLDVGTGSADLPVQAMHWASGVGVKLHITGVDNHHTTLELANAFVNSQAQLLGFSRSSIELQCMDALKLDLNFAPGSIDYVHAGLFLHHLENEDVVKVLASMARIARRGIIWNDLVRSRIGYATIWLATFGSEKMIQHDARASVAAGFTRNEAIELARRGGIVHPTYRWNLFTHRFVLTSVKQS